MISGRLRVGVVGCCIVLAVALGGCGGGSSDGYRPQSSDEAQVARAVAAFFDARVIVERGGAAGHRASRRLCDLMAAQLRRKLTTAARMISAAGSRRPTCADAVASFTGGPAAGEARVVGLTMHGALATAEVEAAGKVSHLQLVRQDGRWLIVG